MKKIFLAASLAIISTAALAEAILLSKNADGSEAWYGYSETFTVHSDGYSVMVGQRFPKSKRAEQRTFFAMSTDDCKRGYGTLRKRDNPDVGWQVAMSVSTVTAVSVGDIIAKEVCAAGEMQKKPKAETSV